MCNLPDSSLEGNRGVVPSPSPSPLQQNSPLTETADTAVALVAPSVELGVLETFLLDIAGDALAGMVARADAEKLVALAEVVAWGLRYQRSRAENGGLVASDLEAAVPQMLVKSINLVMYDDQGAK